MLPHVTDHNVYFSSTNHSLLNFIKKYTYSTFHTISTEKSLWNQWMEPNTPLVDTYTILWSPELEKRRPGLLTIGDPVCSLDITPDGIITRIYTHPNARFMRIATYLLKYISFYPNLRVELPLDQGIIYFFTSNGIDISPTIE